MKLVTFQTISALKELINSGYLECKEDYINTEKFGHVYEWIYEKMNEQLENKNNLKYPLWAWVKFKNNVCPPKHKRNSLRDDVIVKIIFEKNKDDIFITDYRRYSFILNNLFIPSNLDERLWFENKLEKNKISIEELKAYVRKDRYKTHRQDKEYLELCREIRKSWDKCITTDSDVLQACVWRIYLEEVVSIEILQDKSYDYGTFNYLRNNGKRFDWREDFYKMLK